LTKIYSYILKNDSGAAPNPFWGICTLAICKPAIRRTANIGDWVIGTGSKNSKLKAGTFDFSDSIIYAMRITDIKTLSEYDEFCKNKWKKKIPNWRTKDWRQKVGDCIYDYSKEKNPTIRLSVHNEKNRKRDLGGQRALISKEFYYFGEEARPIPKELREIIKKSQGHLKIEKPALVEKFSKWIKKFKRNNIYASPQLKYRFTKASADDEISIKCSKQDSKDDKNEDEKIVD
jgi:hypothetical protein